MMIATTAPKATADGPPQGFVPDPDEVAAHGNSVPAKPQSPLFSSIYFSGTDSRGDVSFAGSTVWASDALVGKASGYSSLDDAKDAAALLSEGDAGAVAIVSSKDRYLLQSALVGGYRDDYSADSHVPGGWRWNSGVRDGLKPLQLDPEDSHGQNLVKLLPWLGVRPGDALLEYRQHSEDEVLLVDGDKEGRFSLEFGLHVR